VTIALAAIMLATPALFHAVAKFVDGVVLRRPDYAEASRAFAEASRRAPDREALFALAVRHVHDVLGLSAVVAQSAAIQGGDGLTIGGGYVLDVTRSIAGRRLMLEELSYLQTVCTEVAHRLESLAFERERQDLLFREERLRHQLTEAELRALRAQVDPHFLFNTLNAVTDLISSDAPRAEAMTEQLAEFFRYTLARRDRAVATLEQEFDFVRRYLEIERVRFGDRLQVVLRCDPAAARHSVPVLLLQPLVENAVRHGLAPKLGRGHLRVSAALDDAGVSITVEDDGVGPPPEGVRGDGVGLRNVLDRVRTMYGPAATLDVARGAGGVGTRVEIHWPAASVPESAAATASEVRRG
jgi:two-component system LytT family sensor kinase